MIREMTLGQYYPGKSIIHRLDPRVKLFGTLLYIISLFLTKNPIVFGIEILVLLLILFLAKVPASMYIKGLKPLIPIMIFSAAVNVLFIKGETFVEWGILTISKEGLWTAGYMLIRLILLITGSTVMTFTTSPNQLMDGFEKAFHFLTVIKIPVHEIAMMMSIALRFIPIMTEELDKIMKAQMSRGADFEEGNLIERAKKLIPILIPLLISAIRRASDLALAMDARCYHGGADRTKLHPLQYQKRDIIAYVTECLYLIGILLLVLYFHL